MKFNSLQDLYIDQLRDLYSAESQLIRALPDVVESAAHPELRKAIEGHLKETNTQKERLERIFNDLGEDPNGHTCRAMRGLIEEANELLGAQANDDVLDAGLIAGSQRIEHYEIAGYGTVCTYAELLDRRSDLEMLKKSLEEEKKADQKLNRIAKEVVNPEAAAA